MWYLKLNKLLLLLTKATENNERSQNQQVETGRKQPSKNNPPRITKTYLYNFDPLKPHFYIVKVGFTGVYIIWLISA